MRVKIINTSTENKKLRVCAYARVSTNSIDQYGSLENQTSTYERLIKSNPEYEFVEVYYDRGMTGSKANRTGFQNMLADARKGEFEIKLAYLIQRIGIKNLENSRNKGFRHIKHDRKPFSFCGC